MLHDSKHALARYNRLFDNHPYSAIANQIAADLRVERESDRTADAMNLVTDTAIRCVTIPTSNWPG